MTRSSPADHPHRPRYPHPAHRRARFFARALMCVAALGLPLQAPLAQSNGPDSPPLRLPALGESAAEDFNVGTERRLGDQIMGEIRRDPDYLDDPALNLLFVFRGLY